MIEHGKSVHHHYCSLLKQLKSGTGDYLLPTPLNNDREAINNLYTIDIMKEYHILHDCGKPFCETIDEQGKKHFPNHAEKSYLTYLSIIKKPINTKETIISLLIKNDMVFHSMPMEQIREFISRNENIFLNSLFITSLAELYSNAAMFGPEGTESTSFKIKYKKLLKISKILYPENK